MNDKELTIWIPVWGAKHFGMLTKWTLPSLMANRNLPACNFERVFVEVCGLSSETDQACEVVSKGLHGMPVEIETLSSPEVQDPIHGLRATILACRRRGTRLLIAMPDTVYGNGSIANMVNYARGKPVTIGSAHLRVNEEKFWSHFNENVWEDNRTLVKAAFDCGAADVCETAKDNVTGIGGIAWTQINEDTRLMLHYLPTPYLCWFTESDESFWFNESHTFGNWDHVWPGLLLREHRWRVIGSSDVFFLVEFESPERSRSLAPQSGSAGNELYQHRRPHNEANGSFLIEVRG